MDTRLIAEVTSAVRARVGELLSVYPDTDVSALVAMVQQREPAFDEIVTALCRAADECRLAAKAVQERITDLKARQERHEARQEAMRALLFSALDAAGQSKWKSAEFTVSILPGRPGVVVTDPSAVPDDFIRLRRDPDKTAIGAALASGAVIPGADLRNGAPTITIRTK